MRKNQIAKGIFFILLAVIISIGIFFPSIQVGFWSAVMMLGFAYLLIKSLISLNFAVSGFSIASLLTLTTHVYRPWYEIVGLPYISTWTLYAVLILFGIGLTLIFGRKYKFGKHDYFYWGSGSEKYDRSSYRNNHHHNRVNKLEEDENIIDVEFVDENHQHTESERSYSGDDFVEIETNFGSVKKYVTSQNFRGGEIEANFGDVKLDLSQAELAQEGAVLNIDCSFGSATVILPKHWAVRNEVKCSLGSVNDARFEEHDTQTPLLLIRGEVSFGSLDILYM